MFTIVYVLIMFKTYLFAIARNKAADYIRRASRYGSVPIEDAEREITQLQSLEEDVLLEEEKRALWDAMNKLNADDREVLYLIYFEELSYMEDMLRVIAAEGLTPVIAHPERYHAVRRNPARGTKVK